MSDVQEELSLSDYIRLLRRHAGKVVIGALVGAAAGLAFGLSAAPRYRASCHVLIEEQRPRVTEMEDLYAVNVSRDFYETQYRLIRSKPVMAAAARKLDLGRQEGPFKGMSDARIGEAILRGISVNPDGNSRLVWISYEGHDQKQAVLIANAAVQA